MLKNDTNAPIGAVFDRIARHFSHNEAIVLDDRRITYEVYLEQVNRLASAMFNLGVGKNDKVAIFMPSTPEWLYAHFAAVKLGATVVPVNTRFKAHELEYMLTQSDATTLFMVDRFLGIDYLELIGGIIPEIGASEPGELKCAKLPHLRRVIVCGEKKTKGILDFNELLEMGKDHAENFQYQEIQTTVTPEDVYFIMFTSGTTGFPKGVVLTQRHILNLMKAYKKRFRLTEKSRILSVSPFSQNIGNFTGFMAAATSGGCILPMLKFDAAEALRLIDQEKITFFCGTPTMFIMLMNHPDFDRYDTRSITCSIIGGADVSPRLVMDMMHKMGIRDVINAYGMTENTGATTFTDPGEKPDIIAGTNGRIFLEGCEVKIMDAETGAELPRGTQGEICTKGWFVMKEYYKMPDETRRAFHPNGWFRTGDLGVMDDDGYLRVTGRLKDMFLTGGYNVYPAEIENILYMHSKVAMAAVIGVPDSKMGEVGMAFIQLKNGMTSSPEEIIDFIKARMANYKIPKYIRFTNDFPLTPSGKIQKFILAEKSSAELGR